MLVELRFFETPQNTASQPDRVYRERFDSVTSRFIGWEIELAYPTHESDVEFQINSAILNADGDVVFEEERTARVDSDWSYSYHFSKTGKAQAGTWAPGWYSAHVSVGGEEIASGWFQVSDLFHRIAPEADQALLDAVPWLASAPGSSQPDSTSQRARLALSSIWSQDGAAGDRVARFGWVQDGVSESELTVLQDLELLASVDAQVATKVADWTWVSTVINEDGRSAIRSLAQFALRDPENLALVAGYPWLADGVSRVEPLALESLMKITGRAARSADAAGAADSAGTVSPASWAWVQDDISQIEQWGLRSLSGLESSALDWEWVQDGISQTEQWALASLRGLDVAASRWDWVKDGVSELERGALSSLVALRETVPETGQYVTDFPWIASGMSADKRWSIWYLNQIATKDESLAVELAHMQFMEAPFRVRDLYALTAVEELMDSPSDFALLEAQQWFADGLNDEDAAFLGVLADINGRAANQYKDLVASHYARASTVDLPLTGEVELIAFRRTPFQKHDDVIRQVEDSLRASEELMGTPFPTNDVILLFTDPLYVWPALNDAFIAFNVGTHMLVTRPEAIEGDYRRAVAHEVSHYYWGYDNAPVWLAEGGANFFASYILDWKKNGTLSYRKSTLWSDEVGSVCKGRGVENVQRLITLLAEVGYTAHADSSQFLCNYSIGEYLLINLFDTLGPEGASEAWKEMYELAASEGRVLTEAEIYQAFSRNTPKDAFDEFNQVYDLWHGGNQAFADN